MELEVPSDQESISDKFKKVKLNYKSFPQGMIDFTFTNRESNLEIISNFKLLFLYNLIN